MKRYIFFVGTMGNGGAQRVISILSQKMAEQGLDVEIMTYYDEEPFYPVDSRVKLTAVEAYTGTKHVGKNLLWLRKYFSNHAKILISFLAPFNMIALIAKAGTGIPIVVADRNDPKRVPSNIIVRKVRDFLYMFADGVVLQTQKNKEYFNGITQRKSKVIYNPVHMGEYAGSSLSVVKEKKIVSAGRLMPQKNQKLMIEAFAEVSKQYPEYRFYIYGEGPSRKELEDLIRQLELAGKVILAGSVADLYEQIKNAQIFVLSSDYEGMPNALIEAMCMGLPVISTKVSGATDLIMDQENGLLVECGDKRELVHAMICLLGDQEKAENMGKKAVELNKMLATETIFEQWMQFLNQINEVGAKK